MRGSIEDKAKEVLERVEESVADAKENLVIPDWIKDEMDDGMIDNLTNRTSRGSDNFYLFIDVLGRNGFTD